MRGSTMALRPKCSCATSTTRAASSVSSRCGWSASQSSSANRKSSTGKRTQSVYRVGSVPKRDEILFVRPDIVKELGVADRLDYLAPRGPGDEAATAQREPTAVISPGPTGYEFGRRSLVRLYRYEVASSTPVVQQVEAIVRLADWDLRYSRNSLALEGYEQAHAFLKKAGTQTAIDVLFSPPLPLVLPTFEPNPLVAGTAEESTGYIDVAFTITQLGEPRRMRTVDATSNATEAAKKRPHGVDQQQSVSSALGPR